MTTTNSYPNGYQITRVVGKKKTFNVRKELPYIPNELWEIIFRFKLRIEKREMLIDMLIKREEYFFKGNKNVWCYWSYLKYKYYGKMWNNPKPENQAQYIGIEFSVIPTWEDIYFQNLQQHSYSVCDRKNRGFGKRYVYMTNDPFVIGY
tara:strand:+ start:1014 stop:1460 length:447 start_codon:yes stop_codon:yes gene_type:complete